MAKRKQTKKREQKAARGKARVKKEKQRVKRSPSTTNLVGIDDAMAMAQAGNLDGAERLLLQIEASHPDDLNLHYSLGVIHLMREEWQAANGKKPSTPLTPPWKEIPNTNWPS